MSRSPENPESDHHPRPITNVVVVLTLILAVFLAVYLIDEKSELGFVQEIQQMAN